MPHHLLIVHSPYYPAIANGLLESARAALKNAGATFDEIPVPGALEIAPAISYAMEKENYDGYVALGCVIRGETSHYDIVCRESASGLTMLGVHYGAAIGNGILTVENEAQAMARLENGAHAANAALALIKLKERFA